MPSCITVFLAPSTPKWCAIALAKTVRSELHLQGSLLVPKKTDSNLEEHPVTVNTNICKTVGMMKYTFWMPQIYLKGFSELYLRLGQWLTFISDNWKLYLHQYLIIQCWCNVTIGLRDETVKYYVYLLALSKQRIIVSIADHCIRYFLLAPFTMIWLKALVAPTKCTRRIRLQVFSSEKKCRDGIDRCWKGEDVEIRKKAKWAEFKRNRVPDIERGTWVSTFAIAFDNGRQGDKKGRRAALTINWKQKGLGVTVFFCWTTCQVKTPRFYWLLKESCDPAYLPRYGDDQTGKYLNRSDPNRAGTI